MNLGGACCVRGLCCWRDALSSVRLSAVHCVITCMHSLHHQQNRWRKRGLAVTPTKFGIAFTKLTYNQGGALVHVYTDGTVRALR